MKICAATALQKEDPIRVVRFLIREIQTVCQCENDLYYCDVLTGGILKHLILQKLLNLRFKVLLVT